MKRSHFWVQDRKFGGKELDRVSGLNLMDFEARIYDPTTGRFYTPDPLGYKNYPISPYAFCANSPISHSDPTGMKVKVLDNRSKQTILGTLPKADRAFFKVLQPEEIFYVILDTVNQSLIDAFRKVMRIVNLKEAGARYKLLTYINRDTRPAYQLDTVFVNMPSANKNTAISSDSIFNYITHQTVRYQK